MRVLMASEDVPHPRLGGLGRHAIILANALAEAGHHVDFVGNAEHPNRFEPGDIAPNRGVLPLIRLAGTGWKEQQLGFYNYVKRAYIARLVADVLVTAGRGYDVIHYHGHFPMVAAYVPPDVNFVQSRHDQGSDCMIHTRFRGGDICGALDPAACARCIRARPNVLQQALSTTSVRAYRRKVGQAHSRHKTIFVSRRILDNLRRSVMFAEGAPVHVVHNFVDLGAVTAALSKGIQRSDPGYVFCGRLDSAKGIVAFLKLLPEAPDAPRITIAGDGPDRDAVVGETARIGGQYVGWQSYESAVQLVSQSRGVVVPSVWEEPCATTILEAMAMGRPVLALARGGTPELTRYAMYPDQLRTFANLEALVAHMLDEPDVQAGIPAAEAVARFTWGVEAAMRQIIEIYEA